MRPCTLRPKTSVLLAAFGHVRRCAFGVFFMNTNFFFILFVFATHPRLSCCPAMPSLSLPFASSQDLNTMLLSDVYSTPGLLGNLSASSGTTAVSPSTPLDGSLLSPANVTYGLNGTLCAPGGPITQDPNTYRQLLRRYQQLEWEFTKEREEHTSLK
jgi:hypothetical protein